MRGEFSKQTKRDAFARAGGNCEAIKDDGTRCNVKLMAGKFDYDHIDPEWMCRDSSLENCQVICTGCHKAKTAKDKGDIAKVKRLQDRERKVRKSSYRPIPGSKASGIKKKFGGAVERR